MYTMNDNQKDEIIDVRLPREDFEQLREILARERSYKWFTSKVKSNWIFVVGGGLLTFLLLYEKFQTALFGTVK